MNWTELLQLIDTKHSFLISSHVSPDGDCIGSQLALYWYLAHRGKKVVIYNHDPVPPRFAFLDNASVVVNSRPQEPFDVLVVLDSSNLNRLGWPEAAHCASMIVNIDHHRDNAHFGQLNFVRQGAATGELIYDFFIQSKIEFPEYVAQALYMAIMTDTGGFRFSNTDGTVLRACADLSDKGANCAKLYERIYASNSHAGLLLLSRIWSTVAFHFDGQVCTMELPVALIKELGASPSDSEGMADVTMTVVGVDIGMFIKHSPTYTHFSLRSKGKYDVGQIAKNIPGGGGHCNAAGCTIDLPLEQALTMMLGIISEELQRS
jgi:phosphoesterase RecJ-like protein